MTESDYISAIDDLWQADQFNHAAIRALVDEGLAAWPDSHDLLLRLGWILHSNIPDGVPDISPFGTIADLHEHTVRLYPSSAEAWTEMGLWYDIKRDLVRAEEALRTAISLGGTEEAYTYLARVLAQSHRKVEALELIDATTCPFGEHPDVVEMRQEIEQNHWSDAEGG